MVALLDEVHATLGPTARVISANRCRSGGLAGFFARESFEVTVEVPDEGRGEPTVPTVTTVTTVTTGHKRKRSGNSAAVGTPPVGSVGSAGSTITIDPDGGRSVLEQLIEAADRADEITSAAPKALQKRNPTDVASTGSKQSPRRRVRSDDFATVLGRAESEQAITAITGGRANNDNAPAASTSGGYPNGSLTRRMFRRQTNQRRAQGPVDRIIDLASLEGAEVTSSLAPYATSSRSDISVFTTPEPAGRYTPRGDVRADDLAALGVPTQWLTGAINGRVLIDSILSRIATPPPIVHAPGTILAFVGEGQMCLNTARAVAIALKQDPANCVFLSPGERPSDKQCVHIRAIDELSTRRTAWVQEDHVTVVAIDAGFGRADVAWGRHAISVLHPSLRWGTVSATRKVEDIFGWARGIGGLHALAVNAMSDTATPAAILSAGVPVARIDGQVASTELWRRLIDDRLAEAATRRTPDLIAT